MPIVYTENLYNYAVELQCIQLGILYLVSVFLYGACSRINNLYYYKWLNVCLLKSLEYDLVY